MSLSRLSSKGWIVIPAELRRKYGLEPGVQVQVIDYGGVLSLIPLLDLPISQAAGMLHGEPSLTKALLNEHAREMADEG